VCVAVTAVYCLHVHCMCHVNIVILYCTYILKCAYCEHCNSAAAAADDDDDLDDDDNDVIMIITTAMDSDQFTSFQI